MANTFTVTRTDRGAQQFRGAFNEMFLVTGTVTDQDAIADDVSAEVSLTVPGVALQDMVLGVSFSKSLADANASLEVFPYVSAADTVTLKLTNIDATADAFDIDTLNGATIKMLVCRPSW